MILGIDPGYGVTGFAVLSLNGKTLHDCGIFKTKNQKQFGGRLNEIRVNLEEILDTYPITLCSIEQFFFGNNKTTMLGVAQARGVILELLYNRSIKVYEYGPSQVKKAITGHGQAKKSDIIKMVPVLMGLSQKIKQDDANDAIALALCHSYSANHFV